MQIENYIPIGRENAVKREELARRCGLSDRKMRQEIMRARQRGVLIINLQDGAGYYRSEELADVRKQYRQNHSRAMDILVQQKYLRRILKEAEKE